MIKVAIDKGPSEKRDSIRGIGMHTKILINTLKKRKDIYIDEIDCWSESNNQKYDILHFPSFHPHFLSLPWFKKMKTILTIHDLIRLIYPKNYPPGIKGQFNFLINKLLIKRADAVVTISETSKKDIIRFLGIPEKKIHVVYLAADHGFELIKKKSLLKLVKSKFELPDEFILYTGDVNYNKNLNTLCEAAVRLKKVLVIVGKQAVEEDVDFSNIENMAFKDFLQKYGKNKYIKRIGYVSTEELSAIYNLATVYCQPSLYEGFGLPILEAFACGCPVVASKIQVFNEIAEGCFVPFDPKSVESLVEALDLAFNDKILRKNMITKGLMQNKKFSWEKTADGTLQVYKKVYSNNI